MRVQTARGRARRKGSRAARPGPVPVPDLGSASFKIGLEGALFVFSVFEGEVWLEVLRLCRGCCRERNIRWVVVGADVDAGVQVGLAPAGIDRSGRTGIGEWFAASSLDRSDPAEPLACSLNVMAVGRVRARPSALALSAIEQRAVMSGTGRSLSGPNGG